MKSEHFSIIGFGAIGQWIYHSLKQAGISVDVLPRSDGKSLPQKIIVTDNGKTFQYDVEQANPRSTCITLLVCVKSYDLEETLNDYKQWLEVCQQAVFFQNGISHLNLIQSTLKKLNTIAAVTSVGITRSDSRIYLKGKGDLKLGCLTGGISAIERRKVCTSLAHPFSSVKWQQDITRAIWRKLAVNVAVNPLTTYYCCLNGDLLSQHLSEFSSIISEVEGVFECLPSDYSLPSIRDYILEIVDNTKNNKSSMLQDIEANRKLELESILGEFLAFAAEHEKAPPQLTRLYRHLSAKL